jgi:hypothetical protein
MVVVETRAGRAKALTPAMMGGAKMPSSAKRLGHTHFLGQSLCVSGPQKTKSEASCFSSHFGKCYLRSDVLFDLLGGNVKVRSSQLLLLRVSWPILLFFLALPKTAGKQCRFRATTSVVDGKINFEWRMAALCPRHAAARPIAVLLQ